MMLEAWRGWPACVTKKTWTESYSERTLTLPCWQPGLLQELIGVVRSPAIYVRSTEGLAPWEGSETTHGTLNGTCHVIFVWQLNTPLILYTVKNIVLVKLFHLPPKILPLKFLFQNLPCRNFRGSVVCAAQFNVLFVEHSSSSYQWSCSQVLLY